jgi:Right handed beta helix region
MLCALVALALLSPGSAGAGVAGHHVSSEDRTHRGSKHGRNPHRKHGRNPHRRGSHKSHRHNVETEPEVPSGPTCTATLSPGANIAPAVEEAKAGDVVCLKPGDYASGEVELHASHGTAAQPVTVTSENPVEPARINSAMSTFPGANYLTFDHLNFEWSMPKPWVCWDSAGEPVPTKVIHFPRNGTCDNGEPNAEDHVQIVVGGTHDVFTWDNIDSLGTDICFLTTGEQDPRNGPAKETLVEHTRIHDCGPDIISTSEGGFPEVNEEWGWHAHAIYDEGNETTIRNSWLYDASHNGVLFFPQGKVATVEKNVIDGNGNGIMFSGNANATVKRNIITNSTSPREYEDWGAGEGSLGAGESNVLTENCLGGNLTGDIAPMGPNVTVSANLTGKNPNYVNAAAGDYRLEAGSPCAGYGPE